MVVDGKEFLMKADAIAEDSAGKAIVEDSSWY